MGPSGPTGGGGSGGSQPDLTENVFSSVAKHIGSGLGKIAENALTLGGAHAFEEGRKKEQQTQAALMQTYKDRASRGETFEPDDYRQWQNAGGDPSVIAGLQKDALGINRSREEARGYLEHMHKGGILNDQQYAMWALALHSNDPTATALAMEGIKSQAALAGIQLRGRMQQQIEGSREGAAQQRVETQQKGAMERTERQQSGAMEREKSREAAATRLKTLGSAAKASGMEASRLKSFGNVADTVAAASGDPGAMKKLKLDDELTPDQAKVAIASANDKLAGTKGVSIERMMGEGGFQLTQHGKGWLGGDITEGAAYGVGLPALVENASKSGTAGITPEIAANFRKQWAAAMQEQDPKTRADKLDAAIATIPDPVAQQEIYAQLQDMFEQVSNRERSESDESDDATSLLNAPDDGDTAPDEHSADTDTGPGSGATLNDWER